jgi:hypothetical protein
MEDNISPQVVFEILSPKNTKSEMSRKLEFYQTYGVEEYYVYDPLKKIFQGWFREENKLQEITPINGGISQLLGISFHIENSELEIYYPNGDKFLNSIELAQKLELEKQRANLEKQRAESEKQRAESEKQRAESEKQRAESEKQRAEKLAQKLRELGINPDDL